MDPKRMIRDDELLALARTHLPTAVADHNVLLPLLQMVALRACHYAFQGLHEHLKHGEKEHHDWLQLALSEYATGLPRSRTPAEWRAAHLAEHEAQAEVAKK